MSARRVLVTGARAPVALHLARLLSHAGAEVILADSHRFAVSSFTRCKSKYVVLPPPSRGMQPYLTGLRTVLDREAPDLVLPTCEEVFFLAAARDVHGLSMPLFAPSFDLLGTVHNKLRFNRLVTGWGIAAPRSLSVRTRGEAKAAARELGEHILKPAWSRFGDRVIRNPSARDLDRIDWRQGEEWVAQAYLPGEEISTYAIADRGRVLALKSYRGLFRASGGAAVAFEPVDIAAVDDFVATFAQQTLWHGQVSFDFRHDRNGTLMPIECNPRATSGLHFFSAESGLADIVVHNKRDTVEADIAQPLTMPFALWTYGLIDAFQTGKFTDWNAVRQKAADLSHDPGDRSLAAAQFIALAEIALLALRNRCGLKAAATADIEWNGEAL